MGSLYEEADGCCPCHVHDELCWLWNWLWNCHDDVPTVHATSACPDYCSPAVHATSACPDYCSPADDGSASTCADYGSPAVLGSQAGNGSIRWYRWHGLADDDVPTVHATSACPDYGSPADDGSAGTSPDYGSPAIHSTSTNTCTNQHDERCFFRNQHDQRCFFRNSDSACLVIQERDNASCKVPR